MCRCKVVPAMLYDPAYARHRASSSIFTRATSTWDYACSGCGLRFVFEPPSLETLVVMAVMDS